MYDQLCNKFFAHLWKEATLTYLGFNVAYNRIVMYMY